MADTSIEWATKAWNPTTGCDQVSPGCGLPLPGADPDDHGTCYALTMAARLKAMGQAKYQADGNPDTSGPGFALTIHPDTLGIPATWPNPERVFVNSMSDLFHPDVPLDFVKAVWGVMENLPRHVFMILTKRPQLMRARTRLVYHLPYDADPGPEGLTPNVWLGTSIETDRYSFRADHLRTTPAAVRFLSLEPLLDPLPSLDLTGIDWVIIGGESGPGARPMDLYWVIDLVARCRSAGIPVFVKQLGRVLAGQLGAPGKGDRLDDLPAEIRVREFPAVEAAA